MATVTRFVGSQNAGQRNREKKGSWYYTMNQITEVYTVQGVDDQYDVLSAVDEVSGLAIPDIGDYYKKFPSGTEVTSLIVVDKSVEQEKANQIWRVYVTYDSPYRDWQPQEFDSNIGKETWVFRFATANQHIACIRQASDRKCYNYDNTSGGGDGGTAINDSNGDPEGVDIMIPQLALTVTKVFSHNAINNAFIAGVKALMCHTNNAVWPPNEELSTCKYKGLFGTEDVLFTGCTINDNSDYNEDRSIAVSYDFLINPYNITETHDVFKIDDTTGQLLSASCSVTKNHGWDYKWVRTKKFVIPEPEYGGPSEQVLTSDVLVDEVYDSASFAALGI